MPPCAGFAASLEDQHAVDHAKRMDGLRLVCLWAGVEDRADQQAFARLSGQWVYFFFHIVSGSCRISGIPIPLGS